MSSVSSSPAAVDNDLSVGTQVWTRGDNDLGFDDGDESSVSVGSTVESRYLKCTTFGFAIPSGATITGIYVAITRRASNGGMEAAIKDARVRLWSSGPVGDDKADTVTAWPTVENGAGYGGAGDLWGTTWTPSNINDTGFGVGLSVIGDGGINPGTAFVDFISITVYYDDAPSPPATTPDVPRVEVGEPEWDEPQPVAVWVASPTWEQPEPASVAPIVSVSVGVIDEQPEEFEAVLVRVEMSPAPSVPALPGLRELPTVEVGSIDLEPDDSQFIGVFVSPEWIVAHECCGVGVASVIASGWGRAKIVSSGWGVAQIVSSGYGRARVTSICEC